jgi:hypothetical protein
MYVYLALLPGFALMTTHFVHISSRVPTAFIINLARRPKTRNSSHKRGHPEGFHIQNLAVAPGQRRWLVKVADEGAESHKQDNVYVLAKRSGA